MGIAAHSFNTTQIDDLNSKLYLTLDECTFFNELVNALEVYWPNETIQIFLIDECNKTKKVADSRNKGVLHFPSHFSPCLADHVAGTKRAYFSNLLCRDPLFNSKNYSIPVVAELGIPLMNEGMILGSIHLLTDIPERKFSQKDIEELNAFISLIQGPLTNMQMYLQAKALNESLQRRIEKNEKELQHKRALERAFNFEYTIIDEKDFIGTSQHHYKLLDMMKKVSAKDFNVLIVGDQGVGKEMVAYQIHKMSSRSSGPFVIFNCQAFNEAYANLDNVSKFEEYCPISKAFIDSNAGTLYLNNIGALSPQLQSKLLRYFQGQEILPVAGEPGINLDVRVLSSNLLDLQKDVNDGKFNHDLFFRLQGIILKVPSLSQRKDDILPMVDYYLNRNTPKELRRVLNEEAKEALLGHDWPGNIREVMNVVDSIQILSGNDRVIKVESLPAHIRDSERNEVAMKLDPNMTLASLERQHICLILDRWKGNKTKTAKTLGITVKTLYNKLHSYGMISNTELGGSVT